MPRIIMHTLQLISIVLSFGMASPVWTGIAVVGQNGHDGQIYVPDVGVFTKDDNFGTNKAYVGTAGGVCGCKFFASGGDNSIQYFDRIYESDPRTDRNRLLTHMTAPRYFHSMSCLNNDTLIICGGYNSLGVLSSCDICHTANPLCVPIFPMPTKVYLHAAVFSDGHLYVIGGRFTLDSHVRSSHLYDFSVSDESWTQRSSMSTARDDQPGAVRLTNGHILVCGGYNDQNGSQNSCESYDPLSNMWTMKAAMKQARSHFALVRSEGRVFAVGGDSAQTVESYDEFYDMWTMEAINVISDARYNAAGAVDRSCVH